MTEPKPQDSPGGGVATATRERPPRPATNWEHYEYCPTCGRGAGRQCQSLTTGLYIGRPHQGRPRLTAAAELETTDPDVLAERQRIADAFMRVAQREGWCPTADSMWERAFPGIALRNSGGFDRNGYNTEGYDRHGYNREGMHRDTGRDRYGFNAEGLDAEGYNRGGFNRDGFNRDGYDRNRLHRDTRRTVDGYDRYGRNADGYDRDGYNRDGYNAEGYNYGGIHRDTGRTVDGFDRYGLNEAGFDRAGFGLNGRDAEGYDRAGRNAEGFDRNGFDQLGYNADGFNDRGLNRHGLNAEGVNPSAGEPPQEDAVWCVACTAWEHPVSRRRLSGPRAIRYVHHRNTTPPTDDAVWCVGCGLWEHEGDRSTVRTARDGSDVLTRDDMNRNALAEMINARTDNPEPPTRSTRRLHNTDRVDPSGQYYILTNTNGGTTDTWTYA